MHLQCKSMVIEVKYLTLKKLQCQTNSLPFLSFHNELIALSDSFSSDICFIRAAVTNHWRKFDAKNSPLSPLITRFPSEESVTENVILRILFDTTVCLQSDRLVLWSEPEEHFHPQKHSRDCSVSTHWSSCHACMIVDNISIAYHCSKSLAAQELHFMFC